MEHSPLTKRWAVFRVPYVAVFRVPYVLLNGTQRRTTRIKNVCSAGVNVPPVQLEDGLHQRYDNTTSRRSGDPLP